MEVKFSVTGKERKALVTAITEITETTATYKGVPSCNYEIGHFTIDRNGTLFADEQVDNEGFENLIESLVLKGFAAEPQETAEETKPEEEIAKSDTLGLTVTMPKAYFTEDVMQNLKSLLEAKGGLIKKALGIDALPIETDDEKVSFPWFSTPMDDSDTVGAYTHLIYALCEMVKNQKRITAKEKEVENEKYAFRCFLLRLGFIGAEYKTERKILLKNFTGSSAFKGSAKNEISE